MASKQADSDAAAKAKEVADLALTEAKKHLAILEALEEANKPSETPTTPSEDEPAETPAEDEPSESPADSGETETIVIRQARLKPRQLAKSKPLQPALFKGLLQQLLLLRHQQNQAQLCRKPAKARISPPFWQGLWHCWPVQVSSPLAVVRRTKSNCINNKSIGKATLFQSRFLYTAFLKN